MAQIKLKDWPTPLDNGGETVLESALAQGVPFPFSCGTGDCGACKARVLCGEVTHEDCPEGILSAAERAEGFILACRCTPKGNVELEALDDLVELPSPRRQRAWVCAQTRREGDVVILKIAPRRPVDFLAGQFFYLKFDNLPARAYSTASLPGDRELEFHVRVVEGGKASGHAARPGLVGSEIVLDGPHGHGYWRQRHQGPLIAVGGGTGLAPVLSIVEAALRQDPQRPVQLYYAARDERDMYWEAELQTLAHRHPQLRVSCCLTRAQPPARGHLPRRYERVTATLRRDWPSLADAKLYVAGPPALVEAVAALGRELSLSPRDLHTDPFSDSVDHALDGRLRTALRRLLARWRGQRVHLPAVLAQGG
jgi:CDP-4-dehydro-6-deoxyglucose reductase/ferredoxin-NAD(P)+ reductase (naphthalene dioxygenase ferredoxin-specific)